MEPYDIIVLLVDDQAVICELVRRALAGQPNIDFHYCSDPREAVRSAEIIRPTVILQDLVMPGMDGLSLVRAYRANPATRDIPIIMLSTKEDPAVKSEAFALGACDYVVKLPDKIELIARIRYHSRAYLNQIQRDEAYRALRESQQLLLEKNLELERLSNVDGLTGLSTRRYFNEFTELQWRVAIREKSTVSVLMIDVDDFKRYNDTYGHLAGDEALKMVSRALESACERPTDLAARFGGEEFIVSMSPASVGGARAFGEKLRRAIENLAIPHTGSTVGQILTVSIGGASTNPRAREAFLPLIGSADKALYEAKRLGKNQVVVLEHVMAAPGTEPEDTQRENRYSRPY